MPAREIILDIETKKTFEEVGGRNLDKLEVSVVGIYSYELDKFLVFEEHEISDKLEEILKNAKRTIGFNIINFDFPVLIPYLSISVSSLNVLDIMQEIQKTVGHRVSLDSVAYATLGTRKIGNGLDAIRFFREGEMDKLREYCLYDVKLTKEIYEYGKKNGAVSFSSKYGNSNTAVSVKW